MAIVLIQRPMVQAKSTAPEFPCPYCGSCMVLLIGANQLFLHQRCEECQEVWTETLFPEPEPPPRRQTSKRIVLH